MQVQKDCFHETWQGQLFAKKNLEHLLLLNPQAAALKLEEQLTKQQLAAAVAGLPFTALIVARLELELQKIELQRLRLDQEQKILLLEAKLRLNRAAQSTVAQLNQDFQQYQAGRSWMQVSATARADYSGGLAVSPATSDLAPTYKLSDDFQTKQAVNIFWKAKLHADKPFSSFFKSQIEWDEKCTTTLGPPEEKFQVKIKEAKSFLKPSYP